MFLGDGGEFGGELFFELFEFGEFGAELDGFGEGFLDGVGELLVFKEKLEGVGGGAGHCGELRGLNLADDFEGAGFASGSGDVEAEVAGGGFVGLCGLDEFVGIGARKFEDDEAVFVCVVFDFVFVGGDGFDDLLENTFDDFDLDDVAVLVEGVLDGEGEIHAVGEEAGIVFDEVVDLCVTGVCAGVEDSDGSGEEFHAGVVGDAYAVQS